MYASQQLRYRAIIDDITGLLAAMALDPRAFPGVVAEIGQLKSSASSPSLRSRDSEVVPMGRSTPDNGGGNVRVVVRVRGFLPRGMLQCLYVQFSANPCGRGRSRRRMSHRDEPRYPSHQTYNP